MSTDSSVTSRLHSPDPRLPVGAGQLLRVRTVWTIPLMMASAVVAVMTVLYISSVVNPLAHLRGLPVAVVNEDRGATIGSQHLDVGQQVQAGQSIKRGQNSARSEIEQAQSRSHQIAGGAQQCHRARTHQLEHPAWRIEKIERFLRRRRVEHDKLWRNLAIDCQQPLHGHIVGDSRQRV